MGTLAEELGSLGAYGDLVTWATPYGAERARALAECPRGDWAIAIAVESGAPRERIVRAACACADLAIELVEPAAIAPAIAAIAAARAWAEDGTAVSPAIASACEELAGHPDPLIQSAAIAAIACVLAIADPREAPAAAASAVSAAALHAADCGAMAAVSYTQQRSADLARAALAPSPTA